MRRKGAIRVGVARPVRFQWRQEQELSFQEIRKAILNANLLILVRHDLPFQLETDASRTSFGGVLKQGAGPSGEAGSSDAEASGVQPPITVLELKAVLFAIEKWDRYLTGKHFKIITDHKALTWLSRRGDSYGKLAQWALQLAQYDYGVEYRPGRHMGLPDAITRQLELPPLAFLTALCVGLRLVMQPRPEEAVVGSPGCLPSGCVACVQVARSQHLRSQEFGDYRSEDRVPMAMLKFTKHLIHIFDIII